MAFSSYLAVGVLWSVAILSARGLPVDDDHPVTVKVKPGVIQGYQKVANGRTINVFQGIPYAQPPVGPLRFRRPQPIDFWSEPVEATALPRSCPQSVNTAFGGFKGISIWNTPTERSEDCLYLNVYAPADKSSEENGRAVMVYIHGGAFTEGSSALPFFEGSVLASRGDVILVTINYRLGALGFLNLGTEDAPGNQGMLDQNMALQWVHDNIQAFGGDASRVTIFGQSAGAASVALQTVSPLSKGLISQAIIQSGGGFAAWVLSPNEEATARANKLAELTGCSNKDVASVIACLREVAADEIVERQGVIPAGGFGRKFCPTLDGYFLTDEPLKLVSISGVNTVNIMTGATHDEGTMGIAYAFPELFPQEAEASIEEYNGFFGLFGLPKEAAKSMNGTYFNTYPSATLRDMMAIVMGDIIFYCPVMTNAKLYTQLKNKAFEYHLVHRTSLDVWPEWTGVMHSDDLDLIFGVPLRDEVVDPLDAEYTDDEKTLSLQMLSYWTNFAKRGNPNGNVARSDDEVLPEWPQYDVNKQEFLVFDTGALTTDVELHGVTCKLWERVFGGGQK